MKVWAAHDVSTRNDWHLSGRVSWRMLSTCIMGSVGSRLFSKDSSFGFDLDFSPAPNFNEGQHQKVEAPPSPLPECVHVWKATRQTATVMQTQLKDLRIKRAQVQTRSTTPIPYIIRFPCVCCVHVAAVQGLLHFTSALMCFAEDLQASFFCSFESSGMNLPTRPQQRQHAQKDVSQGAWESKHGEPFSD